MRHFFAKALRLKWNLYLALCHMGTSWETLLQKLGTISGRLTNKRQLGQLCDHFGTDWALLSDHFEAL